MGEITESANVNGIACHPSRSTYWRHFGSANVCFFDGHVDLLRKDQFYIDQNATVANDTLWNPFSLQ
jgi:prepilin-type processing-associated H-X9-DG protein